MPAPFLSALAWSVAILSSLIATSLTPAADPPPAETPPAAAAPAAQVPLAESPAAETPVEYTAAEQAFVEQMAGCTMRGSFSIDGRSDKPSSEDKYLIQSVAKIRGDDWVINARIVYGEIDLVVPVPVKMHWAADTPVLSVTDLDIPLLGREFSARILFHGHRYAGTWGHGEAGGHMWGLLEQKPAQPETPPGAVQTPEQAPPAKP